MEASDGPHGWVCDVVARFEGPLLLYAQRVLGLAELSRARDVVQETFLRLCRTPRDQVEAHLAPWLYTVCRRAALDVKRKEKRMTLISDDAAASLPDGASRAGDPAASAERADDAAQVLRLLDRLPPNQKECIVLKFGHGLTYKEIAHVTGHSVSNVGVLIHTGLKTVRQRAGVTIQ